MESKKIATVTNLKSLRSFKMFENITLGHVQKLPPIVVNNDDRQHKLYRRFIAYFSDINGKLEEKHLIDGACFAYAWMPTMLHFKSDQFNDSVQILNSVREATNVEEILTNEQINVLARLINNSLVGASKVLHFVNPELYAIWDSGVCKCLPKATGGVCNIDIYRGYLALCHRLTKEKNFDNMHQKYQKQVNYSVTRMRSIEQIFYYNSEHPIQIP